MYLKFRNLLLSQTQIRTGIKNTKNSNNSKSENKKHLKNWFQALTCLHLARDLDPLSTETLFNLGIVYASLRQYCSSHVSWKAADMTKDNETEKELTVLTDCCFKQHLA